MNTRQLLFSALAFCLTIPMTVLAQRAADGGLVPCGDADDTGYAESCQVCHFVDLTNYVASWLVGVLSVAAAIMFVIAGYRILTAGGNQSVLQSAKTSIINVAVGFVIVLGAWLIIEFIMRSLLLDGSSGVGPWDAIQCVKQPDYAALPDAPIGNSADRIEQCDVGPSGNRDLCSTQEANCTSIQKGIPSRVTDTVGNSSVVCALGGTQSMDCERLSPSTFDCSAKEALCTGVGGSSAKDTTDPNQHKVTCVLPSGGGSGGTCEEVTSGNCTAANLTQFGARASEAARICNKESGGTPVLSRSDVCCGDDASCSNPQSFSGGYFQINILAHPDLIPGCSAGFFDSNGGDSIQGNCVTRSEKVFQKNGDGVCLGWSCQITDQSMYLNCLRATTDRDVNFEAANNLYSTRGFDPWRVSAGLCGVPI